MKTSTKIILAVAGVITLGLGFAIYLRSRKDEKGSGEVSADAKKNTIIFIR